MMTTLRVVAIGRWIVGEDEPTIQVAPQVPADFIGMDEHIADVVQVYDENDEPWDHEAVDAAQYTPQAWELK